jgi:hypothetical protein
MATQSIIYFFGGWVCSTNQRHIKQNLDFFSTVLRSKICWFFKLNF